MSVKDLTGLTFHDLTVLRRAGSTKFKEARWLCRCTCGKEVLCAGSVLRRGTKRSCGCLWRTTFERTRICCVCKQEKTHDQFYRGASGALESMCRACKALISAAYYKLHPETYTARSRRQQDERVARRERVLKAYGSKCACCGETDQRFLSMDHVDGGGHQERRQRGGDEMYKLIERENYPARFQALCMNCNWGRHFNGGVCPHRSQDR